MWMREFGTTAKGEKAVIYTIKNKKGMMAEVSDFGATLVSLFVPDEKGKLRDVVLGYDSPEYYEGSSKTFFGVTVGRNSNRIADGRFVLNGITYQLDQNNKGNNLHSGFDFYSFRIWNVKEKSENSITFILHSPDGDQGYPGTVDVEISYTLTEDNGVKIDYSAKPDKDTILNLTNHSFFNLNGHDSGSVLGQTLWMDADAFTPTDHRLIPTGEIAAVVGTPMDFRKRKTIGRDIQADYEPLRMTGGYDHNWCLNNRGTFAKVIEMHADESGITMEVYTDLPGVQIYAGTYLKDEHGKGGNFYGAYQGICFETQGYPDAVHHANFPSTVCKKGETYHSTTIYRFSVAMKSS